MGQVSAIFRKDVRHLWPQIAGFLALVAAYAWFDAALPHRPLPLNFFVPGRLLILALWYMVAAVIHEERPASRRQDWLTRPIPWRSILLAKGLFLVAFLLAPVFVSQIAALAANGFSPLPYLPALVWKGALLLAVAILPAAALAAVTNGLVEFVLAAFGIGAVASAALMLGWNEGWGRVEWIRIAAQAAILLLGLTCLLLFEYARRHTWAARAILACILLVYAGTEAIPVQHAALALGTTPQPGVQLQFDAGRKPLGLGAQGLATMVNQSVVEVMIPVRIGGLPEGVWPLSGGTQVTLEAPGGERWSSRWQGAGGFAVTRGAYWENFVIAMHVFDRLKTEPVHLHTRISLTLLARRAVTNLPVPTRGAYVPGAGICSVSEARFVQCYAPLESSFWTITGFGAQTSEPLTRMLGCCGIEPGFSAWVLGVAVDPLQNRPEVPIETYQATGHFERDLDIPAIRLKDYEVARWRQR